MVALDNLVGKTFWLIGYNDCLKFDTKSELLSLGLKDKNVYFVELDEKTGEYFSHIKDIGGLRTALALYGYSSTVSDNVSSLLFLNPYFISPCAKDTDSLCSDNIRIRDEIISECFMKNIEKLNSDFSPENYNDIVFFGGKPHAKTLQELLLFRGLSKEFIKIVLF